MLLRLDGRRKRLLVATLVTFAFLFACAAALRPWIAQWELSGTPPDRAARRALSLDPGNDRYQALLATIYHYGLLLRNYSTALAYYHSALRSNPLDSASWLQLGKLFRRLDRQAEADRALRMALQLGPSNATILWEASVAYLENEQLSEALGTLARFISFSQQLDDKVKGYDLARRLVPPGEVLERFIPPGVTHYAHYATYLLDRNMGEEAVRVWDRLNRLGPEARLQIDPNLQLRFIDLFISSGRFGPAYALWTDVSRRLDPNAASSRSNLVSNASFERGQTLGKGFDWRIASPPGFSCDVDPFTAYAGLRSLRISFSQTREDFSSVSQVVRVQPDATYRLEAHIKTRGLHGSRGVALEILDPHKGLLARTEMIGGTKDWTNVGVTFRTMGHSEIVTLRIRSEPPPGHLLPVAGTAWIDKVSIVKAQ